MWNSLKKIGSGTGNWLQKKVVDPLIQILKRGAEPTQLAFSAALGITFGLFPICGVTVFLCGLAIAVLGSRCNAPTVMLANFIATPIELSLMIPFLRFGEVVTGGPHFPLTSDALKKVLKGQASQEVFQSIFHAECKGSSQTRIIHFFFDFTNATYYIYQLLGWLVAAPIILAALYVLFLPCFKILVRKFNTGSSSPNASLLSPTDVRLKVRDV